MPLFSLAARGKQRTDVEHPLTVSIRARVCPPGFHPLHGLRHHFTGTLASSGEIDLYTLHRLLTPKDPSATQRYALLGDETLRSAAGIAIRAVAQVVQKQATEKAAEGE